MKTPAAGTESTDELEFDESAFEEGLSEADAELEEHEEEETDRGPGDSADEPGDEPQLEDEEDPAAEAVLEDDDLDELDTAAGTPAPDAGSKASSDSQPSPFRFKADGKEVDVPRAVVTKVPGADGAEVEYLVVPMDEFRRSVQPHLADRSVWQEKELEYKRQIAQLAPELNPRVKFSEEVLKAINDIVLFDGEDEQGLTYEDKLLAWADQYRKEHPVLERDAENAALRAQLEARNSIADERSVAEEAEALEAALEQTFAETVAAELAAIPEAKGLDANELMSELIEVYGHGIAFQAPEDMPQFGLTAGQWAIRSDLIETHIRREAAKLGRRATAEEKAREIEGANARTLGGRKARTSVSGKGSPSPGKQERKITSREDWEAQLDELIQV